MGIDNLIWSATILSLLGLLFYILMLKSPILDECPHCGLSDQTEGEEGSYKCPVGFRNTGTSGYEKVIL